MYRNNSERVYETPRTEIVVLVNESPILELSNTVVAPDPVYPD